MRRKSGWAGGLWAAALCLLSVAASADPAALTITSPAQASTVKGNLVLSLDLSQTPALASVQYFLNGRELGPLLTRPPFGYTWPSAGAWDGPATLRAMAKTADGATVISTPEISLTIANGTGVIQTLSPDLTHPLGGQVQWKVQANRTIAPSEASDLVSRGYAAMQAVEAFMFFVDGRLLQVVFSGNSGAVPLDTRRFANGQHELFVAAYSSARGAPPLAMQQTRATFDNGRALQELRPRWREVFLTPGQSLPLEAQWIYTNGDVEAIGAGNLSAGSSAAGVVAIQDGQIVAQAAGEADVTVTSAGYSASFRALVASQPGLPHFTRDGQVATSYQPGRSFFVRSMFNLSTTEMDNTPGLADQVRAAAINTLTNSLYSNPADNHQPDYATWAKGWDATWNKLQNDANRYQMSLLLTGDDIARTPSEMANSIQNPWSAQAIQHAFSSARDSKLVLGVEMTDEVTFQWGNTPKPTDGRWQKLTPPLPNDSFLQLMSIINGVSGRPAITWPVAAVAGNADAGNWLGDPQFAGYASLFWDKLDWRAAYPSGPSLPQIQAGQEYATVGRFPVLQLDKPMLMQVSVTGAFYVKLGPGNEFALGQDRLQSGGWIRPELCAAQPMLAVAAGTAGVRAYAFDSAAWKSTRTRAKIGQGNLQTGAEPFQTGTDRWRATAAVFNLIQKLEPYLLQPRINALNLGAGFVTAARGGPRSRLFMAINFSESDATAALDFTPYRYPDASTVKMYRLLGGSSSSATAPNSQNGTVSLHPGETVIWLFQPADAAAAMAPSVSIASPDAGSLLSDRVTVTAAVEDHSQLGAIDLLLDGLVVDSTPSSQQFTCDLSQELPGTAHSLALVAHFLNGDSSEARISVWTGPPVLLRGSLPRSRESEQQF